jgi:hypothetical protein
LGGSSLIVPARRRLGSSSRQGPDVTDEISGKDAADQ